MSLKLYIDKIKIDKPHWKSKSQIIGKAGEKYFYHNLKCLECLQTNLLECKINEKSKDIICKSCNKKYQIKCKKYSQSEYNNLKKKRIFKTIGAEYNTTLRSINENIDYIIILYDENRDYLILNIIHVKSINITEKNIIPRKPLGPNAKRAGWQGCYLHFSDINFIHSI